jgi:uncharacterized membrane protein (DUF485 family)
MADARSPAGDQQMTTTALDWSAIEADPRFQELHRRKSLFLWGLMAFSVVFYFLLPIGAAYFTELYKVKLWGVINFGLVFALSEFVVAWAIAYVYSRKAAQFDIMAEAIIKDAQSMRARA